MSIFGGKIVLNELKKVPTDNKLNYNIDDNGESNAAPDMSSDSYELPDDGSDSGESPAEDDNGDYELPDEESGDDGAEDPEEDNTEDGSGEDTGDDNGDDYGLPDEEPEDDGSGDDGLGDDDGESGEDTGEEEPPAEEPDELQSLEDEIFKDLSKPKQIIRNKELNKLFVEMYNNISDILVRIERVPKNSDNLAVLGFSSKKLIELRTTIYDYITATFKNNTYTENLISYNEFIATLSTINKMISEIKQKEE